MSNPITIEVISPQTINLDIGNVVDREPYEGSYTVTPKVWSASVLDTDGKRMTDDVTVLKIPQYETENIYGGYTLNVGDDYSSTEISITANGTYDVSSFTSASVNVPLPVITQDQNKLYIR